MKSSVSSLVLLAAVGAVAAQDAAAKRSSKPNIIVILTDDQDLQMDSLDYMQGVKTHLTEQGTYFAHHYCTQALCCPSRVNLWTGKAAHNTNVTDLMPPYGGYDKFLQYGWNKAWLPTFLQEAGYNTYFTGKLMNSHSINNYQKNLTHLSLTGHDFLLEPGTYQYLNATFQHNLEAPTNNYLGVYATDLVANKSLAWIDVAAQSSSPFFLAINPVNPHANLNYTARSSTPPIPAERYAHLFPDVEVPRTENYNPNVSSGASWVYKLKQLNSGNETFGDTYYRKRLQALQAVDDLVNRTIAKLDSYNMLDQTYIWYTSDNGFHIGQHRLTPGKRCPYESDISVPLIVRGPGVAKGAVVNYTTSHTDITPTIVELAGAKGPGNFDGVPIPLNGSATSKDSTQVWEHVQVESWGLAKDSYLFDVINPLSINTYKAVRLIGSTYSLYYSVWCDGSHEVYDMIDDPYQMKNLYNTTGEVLGVSLQQLQNRLDALTLVLKTCEGEPCYLPWSALDPSGNTQTLLDALNTKYDSFYADQPKVGFEHCAKGYIVDNELPINYMTFGNHSSVESRNAEAMENWLLMTD